MAPRTASHKALAQQIRRITERAGLPVEDAIYGGQLLVLAAMERMRREGRPIKFQAVVSKLGMSGPNSIMDALNGLRRRDLIRWDKGKAGSIVLLCRFEAVPDTGKESLDASSQP